MESSRPFRGPMLTCTAVGTFGHRQHGGIPYSDRGAGRRQLAPRPGAKVTGVEALRLLISMGPVELMHFQTFSDKAGKAPPLTDPTNGLTFPDLNSGKDPNNGARGDAVREMFQTNLIMPEPCPFINASLPVCSVVRPTNTTGAARERSSS